MFNSSFCWLESKIPNLDEYVIQIFVSIIVHTKLKVAYVKWGSPLVIISTRISFDNCTKKSTLAGVKGTHPL